MELARELAEQQDAAGFARPRAVVPVPTAGKSQGAYALNPLICGELAKAAGTVVHRVLGRRPGRPPQVELDFRGRLEGLEDYIFFSGGTRYSGATLWLVDDVYTTGTTADVCAQVLLSAGAASVYLLVLAS